MFQGGTVLWWGKHHLHPIWSPVPVPPASLHTQLLTKGGKGSGTQPVFISATHEATQTKILAQAFGLTKRWPL